jgi:hypothetical protein
MTSATPPVAEASGSPSRTSWLQERPALACCLTVGILGGGLLAAATCAALVLGVARLPDVSSVLPPTTVPAVTAAPAGTIVLSEDFSDNSGGWYESSDEFATHDLVNGGYRILVHQPNYDAWAYAGLDLTDVVVAIEADVLAGPADAAVGLLCRAQDDDNFYVAYVTSDGWASIFRKQQNEFVPLHPDEWIEIDLVRDGVNELALSCRDTRLSLMVNQETVIDVEDDAFAHGDVGFLAGAYDQPGTEVFFDNLLVTEP